MFAIPVLRNRLIVLLAVSAALLGGCQASKKLVLLGGPHHAGAGHIHKFLDRFATTYDNSETSASLAGWQWPTVRSAEDLDLLLGVGSMVGEQQAATAIRRHELFSLLFTKEDDGPIQQTLLAAIRDSWEESLNGIVLGTDYFDKVGKNPDTGYDSLRTVYRLKEDLGIVKNGDVVVVLLYRSPRLDQWTTVWHEKSDSESEQYPDFVCGGEEDIFLYEMLDTSMNPLKLANVYRQSGFNVVLIDEEGVQKEGGDVAHIFACHVLHGVDCEDGWISDLAEYVSFENSPQNRSSEWEETDAQDLERVFQRRDCAYKPDLLSNAGGRNSGFEVVRQSALWRDCNAAHDSSIREDLMDADFFVDIIKSQQGCGSQSNEVSDILWPRPSSSMSTTKTTKETVLWVVIPMTIIILSVTVGMFLIRKRRSASPRVLDGLFKGTSGSKWAFRNHHSSEEGSTEGSSDDESPSRPEPAPSGFVDICIDGVTTTNPPSPPRMAFLGRLTKPKGELCRACKMVGVDPKCTFCGGGRFPHAQDDSSSSFAGRALGMARVVRGTGANPVRDETVAVSVESQEDDFGRNRKQQVTSPPNGLPGGDDSLPAPPPGRAGMTMRADLDDLNSRWQSANSHPSSGKDDSIGNTTAYDHSGAGRRGGPHLSTDTTTGDNRKSRESKSTVFRKLKQLLDLKKTKEDDSGTQNLQLGRNAEISDNDDEACANDLL
jgi:hypothetical protein